MKRSAAMLKMKNTILLFCIFATGFSFAQSASPTVYSSTGGSGSVNSNFLVDYTVGEPMVLTLDPQNNSNILTQGFQQPLDSVIGPIDTTGGVVTIFNGLTPNGDGKNDTWFIGGIDSLPDNAVYIYNRWGELIWKGEHYDNMKVAWDGKNTQGQDVPTGTYFFAIIIKDHDNFKNKGWVELSR
jgi:gliding motility-associated-like protein